MIEIKINKGDAQTKISGNPGVEAAEFSAAIGGISKSISDAFDEKMPGILSLSLKHQMAQYLIKAAAAVLGAQTEEAAENNEMKISTGDIDELKKQMQEMKNGSNGE